jgi:hypothetical protein
VHKGTTYPGDHAAIVDQDLWDKVHTILAENARTRSANTRAQISAPPKGLIFGPTGAAMSPTHHTRKGNRLYRYYVSQDVLKLGSEACPVEVPEGAASGHDETPRGRPAPLKPNRLDTAMPTAMAGSRTSIGPARIASPDGTFDLGEHRITIAG